MSTLEMIPETKPNSRSILAFGIVPLAAMLLLAVIGPAVLTVDPNRQVLADAFAAPFGDYLFGADSLGRSVAARVNTKYAAKLKFLADESFDEGSHIDALLRDPKVARDLHGEDEA